MASSSSSSLLKLVFEPDNPCNSLIHDAESGDDRYTVVTEHGKDTITKVADASGAQLAQWVWHEVRSDVLTLGNAQPVSSSAWLRKSMIPFMDTVEFKDLQGRKFKWHNVAPGQNLELYYSKDKKSPIASFRKHNRYKDFKTGEPVNTPATLTVAGIGLEIVDLIVISFCMLEKSRRIEENGTESMIASHGIPDLSLYPRPC